MDQPLRDRLRIGGFTAMYLAVAAMVASRAGNLEFVFYIGIMLVLVGLVWVLDRQVPLTTATLWALSAWGLAHMAGGLLRLPGGWPANASEGTAVLYNLWLVPDRLKYDQAVHAFGFGVTTWICWQALASALRRRNVGATPSGGLLLLCAAAGMGFGALNEVVEFAATLLVPETNVGGYFNTGWDLVANLVGCVVAAVTLWIHGRASR